MIIDSMKKLYTAQTVEHTPDTQKESFGHI